MAEWAKILFWSSLMVISYSYLGYGILISTINFLRKAPTQHQEVKDFPEFTLIIPAFNEKELLAEKWEDCQKLIYPKGKLHFLFVTDGSSDESEVWLHARQIPCIHHPERKGKTGAINHAMAQVKTPLVAICDANTRLSPAAILLMVRHFEDPKIGAVNGEKTVIAEDMSIQGEGIYWKYESYLKRMDARLYTVAGAAGELLAFRTLVFIPFEPGVINDDLVLSLRIIQQGYRIAYEPNAWAAEKSSPGLKDEWKRKVRMNAGAWQALQKVPSILNPFIVPLPFFQFFSHRLLRWSLCPLALFMLPVTNFLIVSEGNLYSFLFYLQSVFFMMAFVGWILSQKGRSIKLINLPYYFVFMHLAVFPGFWRWLTGTQSANWESIKRHSL